uniref:Uncharacterized protein n=1 Tax=Ditylenchus dipsaci TaxID=166011 RepID=A0A915D8S7_9BILA
MSSMHGGTKPAALELKLQNIHPSILPREMLQNLDRLTVEALCALGREIIQDLLIRAMNLFSVMKLSVSNTNRNAPIDVESIMTYCQNLFSKLAEIRIRIDLKRSAEANENGTTVELNPNIG